MAILEKKQLSGFINPRWMKPRCVRYWEIGAIPAILGLWMPDFVGQYALKMAGNDNYAFPPFLTYVGALFLFAACAHAIENMGTHYKLMMAGGWSAIALAALSVLLHLALKPGDYGLFAILVLCIGLCAYAATMMFYFTISKAAEIGMETRMENTRKAVMILGHAALAVGALSVVAVYLESSLWIPLLRTAVVLFSITWIACRIGVYFFKEDKSIGVTFVKPPNEQFWI